MRQTCRLFFTTGAGALFLALSLVSGRIPLANAQETSSAEEIAKLEVEFGAPIGAWADLGSIPEGTEEPGPLPAELKKMAGEKELVAISCALSKWQSRRFNKAMDAVQKYFYPVVTKARALFALGARAPNVADFNAEMNRRTSAICAAKTTDDAQRLIGETAGWATGEFGRINGLKEDIRNGLKTRSNEKKSRFDEVAGAIRDIGQKIDDAVRAKAPDYEQFREKAYALRQELILNFFDRNTGAALAALESQKDKLAVAKKQQGATAMTLDEIGAAFVVDRAELASALGVAAMSDDEAAFQAAVAVSRGRWVTYQQNVQKGVGGSSGRVCVQAEPQLSAARQAMELQLAATRSVLEQCRDSQSEECLRAAPALSRLTTIAGKTNDVLALVVSAQNICTAPATADVNALAAILRRLQGDSEVLRLMGEAFEAEKSAPADDTVAGVCGRSLPRLEAALAEIERDDLVALKANVKRCQLFNKSECQNVNRLAPAVDKLAADNQSFRKTAAKIIKACLNGMNDQEPESLDSVLHLALETGDRLRQEADRLGAGQAEKGSMKAYCRAVVKELAAVRVEAAAGRNQAATMLVACGGKSDARCRYITVESPAGEIIELTSAVYGGIGEVLKKCQSATAKPPSAILTRTVDDIRADKTDLLDKLEQLKRDATKSLSR